MNASPDTPIFTIGYGNREFVSFVDVLRRHSISYLCDVRTRPHSAFRPEFSRDQLEPALAEAGITYVFLGDTLGGDPEDATSHLPTRSQDDDTYIIDYEQVRKSKIFQTGIQRLHTAYAKNLGIALMCSELKPELCHRARLIGVQLEDDGIPVAHIDEQDALQTQRDVMLRIDKGQAALPGFGPSPRATRSSKIWHKRPAAKGQREDDDDQP